MPEPNTEREAYKHLAACCREYLDGVLKRHAALTCPYIKGLQTALDRGYYREILWAAIAFRAFLHGRYPETMAGSYTRADVAAISDAIDLLDPWSKQ